MSAQPVEQPRRPRGPVKAIPRTIDAIADALTPAKRMAFYREVGGAEQGQDLDAALSKWWKDAMLDKAPGRDQRLADTRAGRNLVSLDELAARMERSRG